LTLGCFPPKDVGGFEPAFVLTCGSSIGAETERNEDLPPFLLPAPAREAGEGIEVVLPGVVRFVEGDRGDEDVEAAPGWCLWDGSIVDAIRLSWSAWKFL
jgi:hypothetical protein